LHGAHNVNFTLVMTSCAFSICHDMTYLGFLVLRVLWWWEVFWVRFLYLHFSVIIVQAWFHTWMLDRYAGYLGNLAVFLADNGVLLWFEWYMSLQPQVECWWKCHTTSSQHSQHLQHWIHCLA